MDAYQVRTCQGWHHHMTLALISMWFLSSEPRQGQQSTPTLTLPHVRSGLSLLLEVYCTPTIDYLCRHVYRQRMAHALARCSHYHTHNCLPPKQ